MPKSKQQSSQKPINQPKASAPAASPVREVEFVLECTGAEQVYVCGDFNRWQPACLRMVGRPETGLWQKRITLPAGRHEYKFIVDGKWVHDPDARENVPNVYGSLNSVLEVQP